MDGLKHDIVCISTIDWDFVWQGHQEIMSSLARAGHRVLFIENTGVRRPTLKDLPRIRKRLANWRTGVRGIRLVMDNLYVYSPVVLPFPYSKVARIVNKMLMLWTLKSWTRTMRFDNPIVWTWLPTALALEIIRVLDAQLVVYYCCDDFQASSSGSRRIRETEDILLRQADLVFVHSKALFDRCSRFTNQIHVFQYGFNHEVFAHADERLPEELASIRRPILGYVGGVHQHVDLNLLEQVALRHSDKSLVLIGPLQVEVERLSRLSNVHFLGQHRYEELPAYIRHFDLGLIPYRLNEYTRSVYPTKLNEYLIMGKPVVSTKLPEIVHFNQDHEGIVSIADGPAAFVDQIDVALATDSDSLRNLRRKLVEKNSWKVKIETMKGLIEAKLEEKSKYRDLNWQHALSRVFRSTQRRGATWLAVCALVYGLVFHSPLLWWLADPLRVIEEPEQADVIVVLAGGVGESGDAGEEYQEKVKRAVELYEQGHAGQMIFSSGAQYVFREAQVMKALALALGVPDSAIILDELGGGNYWGFLSVKRILMAHGWQRFLLVTSHYNGARSRLVVRKNCLECQVTVTPAEQSTFFGRHDRVELKHLRAIIHEYGAITYYWWKGYI